MVTKKQVVDLGAKFFVQISKIRKNKPSSKQMTLIMKAMWKVIDREYPTKQNKQDVRIK